MFECNYYKSRESIFFMKALRKKVALLLAGGDNVNKGRAVLTGVADVGGGVVAFVNMM